MHEDEVLFTEFFNEKLKERGLTLKQLSQATGIAMKHLESFSHGRFEHLPSAPYVHGYFVKLGSILGFDPDEWWDRIKEKDEVHRSGGKDRMPDKRFGSGRGRVLAAAGIVAFMALVYFGARFTTILGEPQILLAEPRADITEPNCVRESLLAVRGRVENGDSLTIGDDPVPLEPDGSFSKEILLGPNDNTIVLRAQKTLGRETTLTRKVCYDATRIILPAPEPGPEVPPTAVPLPTSSFPSDPATPPAEPEL